MIALAPAAYINHAEGFILDLSFYRDRVEVRYQDIKDSSTDIEIDYVSSEKSITKDRLCVPPVS